MALNDHRSLTNFMAYLHAEGIFMIPVRHAETRWGRATVALGLKLKKLVIPSEYPDLIARL